MVEEGGVAEKHATSKSWFIKTSFNEGSWNKPISLTEL